jgi:hypothetical protein
MWGAVRDLEIQLAPDLLRSIKVTVDLDPMPGQFLLTGSSRILALRTLPDALPGRMEIIELWPFSQGEIVGTPDRFLDAAFAHGPRLTFSSGLRRRDYLERVASGGFPEAVRRSAHRRAAFFDSYLSTLVERVLTLASIERHGELLKLIAMLAAGAGGLIAPGALARRSGIPRTTLIRYLELFQAVFLVKRIPAWSPGHDRRAVGTPSWRSWTPALRATCSDRTPIASVNQTARPAPCWRTSSSWSWRGS